MAKEKEKMGRETEEQTGGDKEEDRKRGRRWERKEKMGRKKEERKNKIGREKRQNGRRRVYFLFI